MKLTKQQSRNRIHNRIRKKVSGTAERPRLSVYRSNKSIYCQLIDDVKGETLLSASSHELSGDRANKTEQSRQVGQLIAQKSGGVGIKTIVFDRGGYLYHGRVKALAEGAREGGLDF